MDFREVLRDNECLSFLAVASDEAGWPCLRACCSGDENRDYSTPSPGAENSAHTLIASRCWEGVSLARARINKLPLTETREAESLQIGAGRLFSWVSRLAFCMFCTNPAGFAR